MLERISGRRAELTDVVEQLRKQLADAEHELERLSIAEEVIAAMDHHSALGSFLWCGNAEGHIEERLPDLSVVRLQ